MRLFFKGNIDSGVPENFSSFTEGFGVGGAASACVWAGFSAGTFFFSTLGFSFFGLVSTTGVLGRGRGLARYAMASASYLY